MVDCYIKSFSKAHKEITNFIIRHRQNHTEKLVYWRYIEFTKKHHINFIAVDKTRLIGLLSFFMRKLIINGKEHFLADLGHVQVDKDYQGKGVFSKLTLTAYNQTQDCGILCLFAIPNRSVMRIFLKQDWAQLGNIVLYSKNLSIYSRLHYFIHSERICRFLDKLYAELTTIISAYPFIRTTHYTFSQVTEFSDGCESLCRTVNESIPIMRLRDRAFLTWRFMEKPLTSLNYKVYHLYFKGQLKGYLVLLFDPDSNIVTIADFLADYKDMPVLLKMAMIHLRSFPDYNISKLKIGLSEKHLYGNVVRLFGFTKSPYKLPLMVKIQNSSDVCKSFLLNPRNWHITYADKDTI